MELSAEIREEIIRLLQEGVCPLCGKTFANPLVHIARTHKVPSARLRAALKLSKQHTFASPEFRKRAQANSRKQLVSNPEHLAKWKQADKSKGGKASAEAQKIAVVRISKDGETKVYDSMSEAAADNPKVSISSVSRCAAGKLKTTGGYKWEYK